MEVPTPYLILHLDYKMSEFYIPRFTAVTKYPTYHYQNYKHTDAIDLKNNIYLIVSSYFFIGGDGMKNIYLPFKFNNKSVIVSNQ
jgi:hypothetical protein